VVRFQDRFGAAQLTFNELQLVLDEGIRARRRLGEGNEHLRLAAAWH
jgi:hypothetical protein